MAALLIKRIGCPVSKLSTRAISSALASIESAIACSSSRLFAPDIAAQSENALCAAWQASSTSCCVPNATSPIIDSSIGEPFMNVSLLLELTHSPSIRCLIGSRLNLSRKSCN